MKEKKLLERDDVKLVGLALGFAAALYIKLSSEITDVNTDVNEAAMTIVQDLNTEDENPSTPNAASRSAGAVGAIEFTQR